VKFDLSKYKTPPDEIRINLLKMIDLSNEQKNIFLLQLKREGENLFKKGLEKYTICEDPITREKVIKLYWR
jgi:hypothetical protein